MDEAVLQDATAVRVAVRVRPLITRELLQGSRPCISTEGPCVTIGRDRRFTFDHAFGPATQQEQVYQEVVSPLVETCFDGFNVTVLAYGQTGSGKTFTMGTGECGHDDQLGIAPRVIRHVFQGIEARRHQAAFYVRAQFLEIYNEDVKDLLIPPAEQAVKWISREQAQGPAPNGGGITLRDAGDGTIMVIGASEEPAECAEDLAELLERGMALRATSSTCANEQSSRSHAILTIIIEQHMLVTGSVDSTSSGGAGTGGRASSDGHGSNGITAAGEVRTAKLHLVDLAGSERTKQLRTSMQGARFRETVNINQGLLALGNVISALGDERRRGSHVPYRESKLTRLLQDSLGGNSRTAMIACISPADEVLEETLNTLKYANRAKNIRNKPIVNRAPPTSTVSPLRGVVQEMQLQVLQQLASQLPDGVLARGLPLAELLALDLGDPSTCLDVLTRMKSALATSSRMASMDVGQGAGPLGRQLLAPGAVPRVAGAGEVETLVSGCSRAIAGILQGLAEMEAQGHVNKEAREHILRSLDASTLRLLPVVRSMGPRTSVTLGTPAGNPVTEEGQPAQQNIPAAGSSDPDWERALEDRIRSLESELSSCRGELQAAKDDLDRDEVIFADKMKELQEARAAGVDLKQRLKDTEERHAKEVDDLHRQIANAALAATEVQLAGRQMAHGPSRANSRGRLRPQSGSGSMQARRRSSLEPVADLRSAIADSDEPETARDGSDTDGERGAEEDEVLYDEELLSYISETDYTEQHRRDVLESDAALREELAEVLRDKAAAEADRAALERSALAQRSSFDAARTALEQQLSWLSGSIGKQQQQLQAAQAAEREARDLAAKWQERAEELESAIEAREEALTKLRSDLDAVESNAVRSVEERAGLRQQYEQRIAAVIAQVSALQRQLQQHATSGGGDRRDRQHSFERTATMEAELTRLRSQQADLRKQLSDRVTRYERESAGRLKELAALRKAASAARGRMQALEQENRAQRLMLREKHQEVLAAEQRLRDSQRIASGATRSRSSSPGNRGYLGRGSSSVASGETGSSADGLASSVTRSLQRGAAKGAASGGVRQLSPGAARPPLRTPTKGTRPLAGDRSSLQRLEDIAAEDLPGPSGVCVGRATEQPQSDPQQLQEEGEGKPLEQRREQQQPVLTSEEQQELGGWAEELLAVVGEVAGVEARVEVLASRHRELLGRRELLIREQSQFGLRTQRRAEQLVQAVAACETELGDLVGRIPSPRYETPPSSAPSTPRMAGKSAAKADSSADVTATAGFGGSRVLLSDEWVALQQRIADISHAKAALEERLRSGRLVDDREQQIIDSLDDQLDDLETQLSYVSDELDDRRAALAQLQRHRDQLQLRAAAMGATGLRLALSAATDAVGHRAYQVRQLEAALAASEAGAARREAQLHVRLRESLVSLSAHIASLEATSPGSSACMNSSELRDLLGMYLDFSPSPSSGAAQQGVQQPAAISATAAAPVAADPQASTVAPAAPPADQVLQPSRQAAGSVGSSGRDGALPHVSTPSVSHTEEPLPQQHTGTTETGGPSASACGDGAAEPGDPGDALPEAMDSFADSLAGWGGPRRPDEYVKEEQGPVAGRGQDSVDLAPQAQPSRHQGAANKLSSGPSRQQGNGFGSVVSREHQLVAVDTTAPAGLPWSGSRSVGGTFEISPDAASREGARQSRVIAQSQPQHHHHRTGSGGTGGGATPGGGGGILRRAGSMDSVGSVASSSGKRVTWSAHVATGPVPASAATAPPFGSVGQGRLKERSILDRAVPGLMALATRPVGASSGAGGGVEAHGSGADSSTWLQDEQPQSGNGRHGPAVCELGTPGGHWSAGVGPSSSDGDLSGGGGSGGREEHSGGGGSPYQLPRPFSSRSSLSISSVDTDDAAAVCASEIHDGGSDPDDRDTAADGGGGKAGVRSFNPWRCPSSAKQRRGAWEQPQVAGEEQEQGRLAGGHQVQGGGEDGGEDDLLLPQDSDSLLEEESAPNTGYREQAHPGLRNGPAGWSGHVVDGGNSHQQQPQGNGGGVPRQEGGRVAATAASRASEAAMVSLPIGTGAVRGVLGDGAAGPYTKANEEQEFLSVGFGSNTGLGRNIYDCVGDDEDDDEELEEQVQLLAQASIAARRTPTQAREPIAAAGPHTSATSGTYRPASVFVGSNAVPNELASDNMLPKASLVAAGSTTPTRRGLQGQPVGHGGTSASALQPPPLPAPARSISPVQHYGRLQRQRPEPGPGPFTTPAPVGATTALSEALQPYKAHLKRSGSVASGGGAGLAAGRTGTPEGRRVPTNTIKAGFSSPQQQQRSMVPAAWLPAAEEVKSGPSHQHRQQQQPWRHLTPGAPSGAMNGPSGSRLDKDGRQAAVNRAPRHRSFVP